MYFIGFQNFMSMCTLYSLVLIRLRFVLQNASAYKKDEQQCNDRKTWLFRRKKTMKMMMMMTQICQNMLFLTTMRMSKWLYLISKKSCEQYYYFHLLDCLNEVWNSSMNIFFLFRYSFYKSNVNQVYLRRIRAENEKSRFTLKSDSCPL